MRQLLALAIAVFHVGTPYAQSPGNDKGAAPGTTSRITTVQMSTMPEGVDTSTITEAPQQQQPGTQEQQKKSFWNSPWLLVALGVAGTVVALVPYLVVVGMALRIGQQFRRDNQRSR